MNEQSDAGQVLDGIGEAQSTRSGNEATQETVTPTEARLNAARATIAELQKRIAKLEAQSDASGLIEAAEWHEAETARYAKRARFQIISNFHEGCAQHFRARAAEEAAKADLLPGARGG